MADGRSAREFAAAQGVRRFLRTQRAVRLNTGKWAVGSKDMHCDATKVTAARGARQFL